MMEKKKNCCDTPQFFSSCLFEDMMHLAVKVEIIYNLFILSGLFLNLPGTFCRHLAKYIKKMLCILDNESVTLNFKKKKNFSLQFTLSFKLAGVTQSHKALPGLVKRHARFLFRSFEAMHMKAMFVYLYGLKPICRLTLPCHLRFQSTNESCYHKSLTTEKKKK